MNKWRLWQQQQAEGFTLIEVLASVVLVALAMAALAPTLTVIAYRRAMSERVELANRLAQEEVDRIRTLVDIELSDDPRAFQNSAQLARLPRWEPTRWQIPHLPPTWTQRGTTIPFAWLGFKCRGVTPKNTSSKPFGIGAGNASTDVAEPSLQGFPAAL
jgi:prepilin-type N-terminal cleavage/methylation domain-containing protein